MPIILIIIAIALAIGLFILPGWWVKRVMARYHQPENLFEGTGGELARHLLDQLQLPDVSVEATASGQDHYDPLGRAVRLSPENIDGRSLTAITVAAHEVGHAIQHAARSRLFRMRMVLAGGAQLMQKVSAVAIIAMPFVAVIARSPRAGLVMLLLAIAGMVMATLVHLITLPVEWDASFGKALPLLDQGNYIPEHFKPHAHKILKAAAMTYVAGSLTSMVNLYRWIAILRR